MKKDLPGIINRTARYLNRSVTLEQQKKLCEHLSFESMKNNPMVSHEDEVRKIRGNSKDDGARFMRKGQVGSWNSDLSPQMAEKINQWAREKLNAIDYPFLA
ncbi:hypothetical protein C0J52_08321 [Blattella germanica]|nr:hypothetical protein C0J52_08321 [Blattella germanica]